jgi:hypothetical protein
VRIVERKTQLVEFGLIDLEHVGLILLVRVHSLGADELAEVVLIDALVSLRSVSVPLRS